MGVNEGAFEGLKLGSPLGAFVGSTVGASEGVRLGSFEGDMLGSAVGAQRNKLKHFKPKILLHSVGQPGFSGLM